MFVYFNKTQKKVIEMRFSREECLLQEWLDKKGMTQIELSKKIGWTPKMVSLWCTNKKPMSPEAMYSVAYVLDIRMEYLHTWKPL